MRHTFASATFVVGEGQARRTGMARDVALTVEQAPPGAPPRVGSPFLNGQLRAEGVFFEECRPNNSLLAAGREAVLRLVEQGHWSLVSVLIVKLGEIRSPAPGQRLYEWSFLVTGKPRDALRLFSTAGEGELSLEDLLGLLGTGAGDEGTSVTFDAEGGIHAE
jgi:hypothetical protein